MSNLKEYLVQEIIKHMKHRDKEVQYWKTKAKIFERELKDLDIFLCKFCQKYRYSDKKCEFCEECMKVKHFASWNLSGCCACEDCESKYCVMCRLLKTECSGEGCETFQTEIPISDKNDYPLYQKSFRFET